MLNTSQVRALDEWTEAAEAARQRVEREYAPALLAYREDISDSLRRALADCRLASAESTGRDATVDDLLESTSRYLDWFQWALWDLPYWSIALRVERSTFRRRVSSCSLVYLAIRLIDDWIDGHFLYRGQRPTLLSELTSAGRPAAAEAKCVLAALLLCFEALARLSGESRDADVQATLVTATRRVLLGMIMEQADASEWNHRYYERLVELKNVSYAQVLTGALSIHERGALAAFLDRYYALAQLVNDLQDFGADAARAQPNAVSIALREAGDSAVGANAESVRGSVWPDIVRDRVFMSLEACFAGLDELEGEEREMALAKLHESISECQRLGVFAARRQAPAEAAPLPITWQSSLSQVVDALGANAIEEAACPICAARAAHPLCSKQDFQLVRCQECRHVYVSPRLSALWQKRLAEGLDGVDDPFLDVQWLYAPALVKRFGELARGRRLLDVGFGAGALLSAAKSAGFDVYGVDGSAHLVDQRRPQFGDRVRQLFLDDRATLPWGSFDVICLSHVLEHFPEPRPVLERITASLAPGGLLYVAVPDIDSLQFRIFGPRWDAICPLVHYQYFCEASLQRALESVQLEVLGRHHAPALPARLMPQWARLFRRLEGDESGELALFARLPE